jgi:hypothetical protein
LRRQKKSLKHGGTEGSRGTELPEIPRLPKIEQLTCRLSDLLNPPLPLLLCVAKVLISNFSDLGNSGN